MALLEKENNDGTLVRIVSQVNTYQLVDDSKTDDTISWNEAGTTFMFGGSIQWRIQKFCKGFNYR